jgi:hypothetical protein
MTTEHDNADHSQGLLDDSRHLARAVRWLWDTAQSGGMCLALILRLTSGEEVRGRLYCVLSGHDLADLRREMGDAVDRPVILISAGAAAHTAAELKRASDTVGGE